MPKSLETSRLIDQIKSPYHSVFPAPVAAEIGGFVPTATGKRLATYHWPAHPGMFHSAKGTVVLVDGYGSHLGRMSHVAGFFALKGYEVAGTDLPMHGMSEDMRGEHGYLPGFEILVDAWTEYIESELRGFPTPHFVYSHSLGGLVAFVALNRGLATAWKQFKAIIYSAPMLRLNKLHPHSCSGGALCFTPCCKQQTLGCMRRGQLSGYLAAEEATWKDSLYFGQRINASWMHALHDGAKEAQRGLGRVGYHFMVLQSPIDLVVDPDASRDLFVKAPSSRKRMEEYIFRASEHELHNEKEWRRPLILAIDFIEEDLAPN